MFSSRNNFKHALPAAVLAGLLALAYWPAISSRYAHYDEYFYFLAERRQQLGLDLVVAGRFLCTTILDAFQCLVHSAADLQKIRILGLLHLCVSAWLCYRALRHRGTWTMLFFIAGIFTLPPFEVFISQANDLAVGFLLITTAALLGWKAADSPSLRGLWGNRYTVWSCLFFLCALFDYQPLAMFYWTWPALVMLTKPADEPAVAFRKMGQYVLLGVLTMGVYAAALALMGLWFKEYAHLSFYSPYEFNPNMIKRLANVARYSLNDAANLWSIFPDNRWTVVVVGMTGLTFLLELRRRVVNLLPYRSLLWGGLLIFVLLVMSYLPNLVSYYAAFYYRCSAALTPIVFGIYYWMLNVWINALCPKPYRRVLLSGALLLICVLGAMQSFKNIEYGVVAVGQTEMALFKQQLTGWDLTKKRGIVIFSPDAQEWEPLSRYKEFFYPVSRNTYYGPIMLACALREMGGFDAAMISRLRIKVLNENTYPGQLRDPKNVSGPWQDDVLYVDMSGLRDVLSIRLAASADPYAVHFFQELTSPRLNRPSPPVR